MSGRTIALGVVGFLILATGFFFLGMLCLPPLLKGYWKPSPKPQQTVQAPAPLALAPRTTESPVDTAGKAKGSLDVQVTEEGQDQTANTDKSADSGVKQDDSGLTITLDPKDQQKDDQTTPATADSSKSSETAAPRSHSEKPKSEPQPSSDSVSSGHAASTAPSGKIHYRVQTGMFANRKNAESLASDLRDRGYKPDVKAVQGEAGTLYRVEVGEYKTRQGAQDLADELSGKGYSPSVTAAR
jgi:cell division septation protein DedD